MSAKRSSYLTLCTCLLATASAHANEDLAALDLETLMSMDATITSAARRAQLSSDAAAAVFVLTHEDIRRSGATTLPDALRLVPGLQVSRIATRTWAVSTRGFNSRFSNKLQVLVDGRSIYATIFSGVLWEEQPVPLDSIERIEVIRGPGGALWGINAMNGVINIITRRAEEARGLHASAGSGADVDVATLRYGAQVAELGAMSVYADHSNYDSFAADVTELDRSQLSFRFDRDVGIDHFSTHADYSESEFGDPALFSAESSLPASAQVGSLGVDWRRDHTNRSQSEAHVQYAWTDRGPPNRWDETMLALDLQHTMARTGRHLLTYGAGYRHLTDEIRDRSTVLLYSRSALTQDQWSIYAQDEIYFLEDQIRIIAGAKLEDFKYTGRAFQPTLRAIWHITDEHTLWSAVSNAARSPSRFELHSENSVPVGEMGGMPLSIVILGNEHVDVEHLDAYELGWRWRPTRRLSLDVALFQNEYSDLLVQVGRDLIIAPGFPPQALMPFEFDNAAEATAQGGEVTVEWQAADRLNLQAGARWLDLEVRIAPNASQAFAQEPKQASYARVRWDVARTLELDVALNMVGDIKGHPDTSYETVDVNMGWTLFPGLQLSLSASNVFDDEHTEYVDILTGLPGVTLGRTVLGRITWQPTK